MALKTVYSVIDYGAVHDGVTDDTEAIQAAINACFNGGGGTVYFPNGVYIIGGSLVTSLNSQNPNCQLYIPLSNAATSAATIKTVKLLGESAPNPYFNHLENSSTPPTTGVLLKSTILGSGTRPSVIGSSWVNNPFALYDASFNFTSVEIENIHVRTRTITSGTHISPSMTGINLYRFFMAKIWNCRIDTESILLSESVQPTSAEAIGLIMPRWNNSGVSVAEQILISHYHDGIVIDECFRGDKLFVGACKYNYNFGGGAVQNGAYPAFLGRVFSHAANYHLRIHGGNLKANIELLNIEAIHPVNSPPWNTAWFANVYDSVVSSGTCKVRIANLMINQPFAGGRTFENANATYFTVLYEY